MTSKVKVPAATLLWTDGLADGKAVRQYRTFNGIMAQTWEGYSYQEAEAALSRILGRSVSMDETLRYMDVQTVSDGELSYYADRK